MSTSELPLTIRAHVCRHNPEGHLLPMQWLIHNPALSGSRAEWGWGLKEHAKSFTPEEADTICRKQGGWPEILGPREHTVDRSIPRTIKGIREEAVRIAKAKPASERTIAERIAIARKRQRTMKPRRRPFTNF